MLRFDTGTLRAPVRQPNGFLRVDGLISRTGILEYRNADGSTRREYRSDAEVFDAASLGSFAMVPVTNNHPEVGLLDATNAKAYSVGHVGESVRRDGDYVAASMMVMDAATIADVEAGKSELSCGYSCDAGPGGVVNKPGSPWHGQRYDMEQINVRGNHVAIVARGRAQGARLRLDSDDAAMIAPVDHTDTGDTRMKIMINGVEVDVPDTTAALINAERRDAADKLAAQVRAVEVQTARADAATDKLTKAERERADAADPAKFQARVASRVALQVAARSVLGETVKLDTLDDKAVRVAVLAKLLPEVKLDGKSEVYIEARYDGAMETFDKANPALARARGAAEGLDDKGNVRVDATDADADEAARARMVKDGQEAYKRKPGT